MAVPCGVNLFLAFYFVVQFKDGNNISSSVSSVFPRKPALGPFLYFRESAVEALSLDLPIDSFIGYRDTPIRPKLKRYINRIKTLDKTITPMISFCI